MDAADVRALRKELKALVRRKQKAELVQRRQFILPGVDLQMRAVLIFLLSGSAELASAWAAQEQQRRPWHTRSTHVDVNVALISAWATQWGSHGLVVAAVENLEHPWRIAADRFLMESLLVDRISDMSTSGLAMSSACAWDTYMRLWSYRPQSPQQHAWPGKLDSTSRMKKKYLWQLRRRWGIQCGIPNLRPGLSMTLLRDRVCPDKIFVCSHPQPVALECLRISMFILVAPEYPPQQQTQACNTTYNL